MHPLMYHNLHTKLLLPFLTWLNFFHEITFWESFHSSIMTFLLNVDTLNDYKVSYSFDVPEPTYTAEKHVLGLVCVRAASHLATQRGHEYGFGPQEDVSCRATLPCWIHPSFSTCQQTT